ncbi:MAG: M16 family metallopeptidase [Vulcanimicrobiota bacterium]
MKKGFKYIFIVLILSILTFYPVFASAAGGEMTAEDARKPKSPILEEVEAMAFEPIEFQVPRVGKEVERVELDNGMILYLMEDHRLPLIQIKGLIRTGEAYEKKEQHGVAHLTGKVMRIGGTEKYSSDKLNEELEYIAARLETGIEVEEGWISLEVISSEFDKGLNLFSQVLRYPMFDENKLELEKSKIKESLRRRNDNYRSIGDREFYRIVYPNYANGWEFDWDVVKNIRKDDLVAWHNRFYKPNNMMFAVVGDFNRDEMITRFIQAFGDWEKSQVDLSGLQDMEKEFNPGLYFAKKNLDQSYIRMGHLGIKRTNPDRYSIRLMDYILGNGGFNSWMTEKIRSDEGLAYSVYSYFNTSGRTFGTAGAVCSTKSESTVRAIELMLAQINRIKNEDVTPEKLKWAKDSIINSFVFNFDTPLKQTAGLMNLEYEGLPSDYYENYCENIRKVTVQDIKKVANQYLFPEEMTLIVVGNPEKFDKPLKNLGKPVEIELKDVITD